MKAIWLILAAAAILYSVRQNGKGAEHPAISLARGLFWFALAMRVLIPHPVTTALTVLGLLGLLVARMRFGARVPAVQPEPPSFPAEKVVFARELQSESINEPDTQTVRFRFPEPREFSLADGGTVTLPAGEYEGRWTVLPVGDLDDETQLYWAPMESVLEFTAPDSRRWKTESKLGAAKLLDLERLADSDSAFRAFWQDRAPAHADAFASRCLVRDLPVGNDDRIRFALEIGGRNFCIMQKYLAWKVDLALSEDGRRVFVLARDVVAEKYSADVFATADPSDAKLLDFEEVPPFFYEMPVDGLLPLFNADAHSDSVDSLTEGDCDYRVVLQSA